MHILNYLFILKKHWHEVNDEHGENLFVASMSKCSIEYAWKYHAYWILHSDIDFDGTCGMQDINHTYSRSSALYLWFWGLIVMKMIHVILVFDNLFNLFKFDNILGVLYLL